MRLALLVHWCILLALSCRAGEMTIEVDPAPCPEGVRPQHCPDEETVRIPEGWRGPVLVWSGAPDEAPDCPEQAPVAVYEGYAGLSQQVQCPSCSCGPSACRFSGSVALSEPYCDQGEVTPYPVPEGWDGSCWSNGIIPGPEVVSIVHHQPTEAPCEPRIDTTEAEGSVELSWSTLLRACERTRKAPTCGAGSPCEATASETPRGFATCFFQEGEAPECPPDYPERSIIHSTMEESAIGCSPCTCGPPEGGFCRAFVSEWRDTACNSLRGGGLTDTEEPHCGFSYGEGDGFPLGSISAFWQRNEPGTCAPSGGEPFGEAVPVDPVTFCCQPR